MRRAPALTSNSPGAAPDSARRALYAALAQREPDNRAAAEAARILKFAKNRLRLTGRCSAGHCVLPPRKEGLCGR
jgi:hypothetical protein